MDEEKNSLIAGIVGDALSRRRAEAEAALARLLFGYEKAAKARIASRRLRLALGKPD